MSPAVDRSQLRSRGGNQSPGHVYSPATETSFAKSQFFKNTGSMVFGTSKRLPDQRPRSPGERGAGGPLFSLSCFVLRRVPFFSFRSKYMSVV